jgi:hypothetical protein
VEAAVEYRRAANVQGNQRRELESLLALGSAIAWGALAVSVWSYVERSRARRLRHEVSNRLLAQVFPKGRLE